AIEGDDAGDADLAVVEAAQIDATAVGLRARHVEALHAADRAEMMFRRAGVEAVGRNLVRALNDAEALLLDDEMEIARFAADRAVALLGLDLGGGQHHAPHPREMTSAPPPAHRDLGHGRHVR